MTAPETRLQCTECPVSITDLKLAGSFEVHRDDPSLTGVTDYFSCPECGAPMHESTRPYGVAEGRITGSITYPGDGSEPYFTPKDES